MESYINYLLEDLKAATQRSPVLEGFSFDNGATKEVLEVKNLEDLTDITKDSFPPAEKLSEGQAKQVNEAVIALWKAYNLYAIFPPELPAKPKYELLVNTWNKEGLPYHPNKFHEIKFCFNKPEGCEFGEYCYCRETEEDVQKRYGLN